MKDKINSPEQLNRMMKVSNARIWIILFFLLIVIISGLIWFCKNEIILEEYYPCYVLAEKRLKKDLLHDIILEQTGDIDITEHWMDELIENNGEDYINQIVYPVCLYVKDIANSELIEYLEIKILDIKGVIDFIPVNDFNCNKFFPNMNLSDEAKRKVGLNPGIDYSFVFATIPVNKADGLINSGLYNASVILDVIRPITMIVK